MNQNLFRCPDCGNACSINANSCPHCGRVLRAAPVYITQPPKKTSPFTWFVLVIILIVPVLCCVGSLGNKSSSVNNISSTSQADPKDFNNPSGRQTYANGLRQMAIENGKATLFETEGVDKKTLVIKADNIEKSDCMQMYLNDYGKGAAGIGFEKLVCHKTSNGNQWTFPLSR